MIDRPHPCISSCRLPLVCAAESYKRMVVNRPDTINVNAAVCDEFKAGGGRRNWVVEPVWMQRPQDVQARAAERRPPAPSSPSRPQPPWLAFALTHLHTTANRSLSLQWECTTLALPRSPQATCPLSELSAL